MLYSVDIIDFSKKVAVRRCYLGRCQILIYQECPDISGILTSPDLEVSEKLRRRLFVFEYKPACTSLALKLH
jgi:hypothetical protein